MRERVVAPTVTVVANQAQGPLHRQGIRLATANTVGATALSRIPLYVFAAYTIITCIAHYLTIDTENVYNSEALEFYSFND